MIVEQAISDELRAASGQRSVKRKYVLRTLAASEQQAAKLLEIIISMCNWISLCSTIGTRGDVGLDGKNIIQEE